MEKTYSVMVVEDEALLLQAITKKLKASGFEVVSCYTGDQAFDYLQEMDNLPDAIWLDYYLGNMDGLEFMDKIKTEEKWMKIPVIVVSNSTNQKNVHNMLNLGAKKYLLKANYRLEQIVEEIKKIIETKETSN